MNTTNLPIFNGDWLTASTALLLVFVAVEIIRSYWTGLPKGVPRVGMHFPLLPWSVVGIQSMFQAKGMVEDGYHKYTKQNKPFILPNSLCTDVVVPPSELGRLLSLSDESLSLFETLKDQLQPWWTLISRVVIRYFYVVHVPAVRYLNKLVPPQIAEMMEEVSDGITSAVGIDENWHDVRIFDVVEDVASQVGNYFVIGRPLCRNRELICAVREFGKGLFVGATMIGMCPKYLRPLLGYIFTFPNRKNYHAFAKYVIPELEMRLKDKQSLNPDVSTSRDITQWHINRSLTLPEPEERTAEVLSYRLMLFSLAAVQTVSAATTHALVDIYSFVDAENLIADLREEVETALKSENGMWTMRSLSKMVKVDSAIRESMRLSSFGTRGCTRKVVTKSGITLSNGLHVPYGATITAPQWSIHRDETIYSQADEYLPYRYVNTKQRQESGFTESLATTSATHLAFGHGRHACPGRHFAAAEMKLILAYLLMNYDVKPLASRPQSLWISTNYMPPTESVFQIRRRKATA
ncbi:cytochrome P450 [Xylogone sp. PMI_703]|nr:cytochrome P450 [Xylogone sp. PMI_703]